MTDEQPMKTFADLKVEAQQPVVIADEQGLITYINPQFTSTYLWGTELIGRKLTEIIPMNFHDSHNLGFSRFQITEISHVVNHPINLLVITQDGRSVPSEHYITANKIEEKWYFAAQLRPLNPADASN
jgi:PAS domain S-box-containing protein